MTDSTKATVNPAPGAAPRGEFRVVVPAVDQGTRLDQFLPKAIPGLSRRRARVVLDLGGVFVDGHRTKVAGRPCRKGEVVTVHLGGALERAEKRVGQGARAAEDARLPTFSILHEDADLVVVNKPAGLLTAPTPESDRGNLLGLLERRPEAKGIRHFVVHRLDLPTSGVLVVAKSVLANEILSEKFRTHDLERRYIGVVARDFPDNLERLETPVGGRAALTHVRVIERLGEVATVLGFKLETGRTHQIRIHVSAVGHPIIGDNQHRAGPRWLGPPAPRLALHAEFLGVTHPRTYVPLRFESPLPADLSGWLETVRASVAS